MARLIAIGVAAALAVALAACDKPALPSGGSFKSIDITGADYASRLDLPDADGKPRSLAEWKGKVVVVFFGFTHCPDVCPTTLAEIAGIRQALGPDGGRIQTVFVTVDPERDTPALLKAYVGNFGADNVALRGTPEQTQAVARHFKVFYAKVPGKTEGSYSIDHTAGSYVFDKQGRVRLFTRYGLPPGALQSDLKRLLDE